MGSPKRQSSGNLPSDCRSIAAGRRLVLTLAKVVAQGPFTRLHWIIVSG